MTSVRNVGRVLSRTAQSFHLPVITGTNIHARRTLSSLCRHETAEEARMRSASLLWRIQGHQQRSIVMVTKSKASESPAEDNVDSSSSKSYDTTNYQILSEDLAITPSCIARVEKLVQQRKSKDGGDYFLRVFVDAGGCSGFQYQFEFDQDYNADEDIVLVVSLSEDKPRIVVDETSLGFLRGSKLDFVQEMIKSSFAVVDNPQSESACGCGSSFAVKNFASNPALD